MRNKIFAVFLMITGILAAGCAKLPETSTTATYTYEVSDKGIYELTEHDVLNMLSKRLIKSTNVAVKGVKLGDRYMNVQNKLGIPDYIEEYYDGNTNLQYEKDGQPYIVIHLENNTVMRIVVKPSMESELHGKSKMALTLDQITSLFGKPTEFEDTRYLRIYKYKPRGLEIYIKRKEMMGYGFVMPQKI